MSDVIGTAKIVTEVDSTGVEVGVSKAKRSLADLGTSGAAAGKKASAGVGSIGDSGGHAAQKVEAATKNMIGSIQRTIAAMEAGSKSGSEYYKVLAGQRGIDVNTIKPYLDQLDAAAAKQTKTGISAGQMSYALRGIPAQFTDIATSIAAGQAPLTVFLQQGGQLKDMFGGVGPAAKALGGYMLGLINPLTISAAAAAALAYAFHEGSKESQAFNSAILLTGNYAGQTEGQFNAMAKTIADASKASIGTARTELLKLVSSGRLTGDALKSVGTTALEFARVSGQSADEVVKDFAKMSDGVTKWAEEHDRQYHFLNASVYQHIDALEKQGNVQAAMQAAMDALNDRLKKQTTNVGYLGSAWEKAGQKFSEYWDKIKGIGRDDTIDDKIAEAQQELANLQRRAAVAAGTTEGKRVAGSIANVEGYIEQLKAQKDLQETDAKSLALSDQLHAKAIQAIKDNNDIKNSIKDKATQAQDLIDKYRANQKAIIADGGKADSEKVQSDTIAAILAKYKDKSAVSAGIQLDKAKLGLDVDKVKAQLAILADSYKNTETVLEAQRSAGLISEKDYYDKKRQLIQENTDTEVKGLEDEAARIKASKATGAAGIENQRKLVEIEKSITIAKADAVAKRGALDLQQKKSIDQVTLSYLTARQAAQDYFDTQLRQQQRDLAGMGQGAQQRSRDAGINQIEDRYAQQRLALDNQQAVLRAQQDGRLTDEQQKQYKQRLSIINEFQTKSIASYADYYSELMKKQGDWSLGASEGLNNYLDDSRNVFKQTENLVSDAFGGMEDTLVNFVRTGKLNFGDLADTIIADLARMEIKAAESKILAAASSGGLSGLLKLLGGSDTYTANLPSQSGLSAWANSVASAKGNVFSAGSLAKFGGGGAFTNSVVNQPTVAPMALFGEAGPEAIMPLTRGPDGSLGVKSSGGGQTSITHAPVFNINGSGLNERQVEAVATRVAQASNAHLVDQLIRARRI